MYVCMYECIHTYVCMCACMHVCTYTHTHRYMYTNDIYIYTHVYMCVYARAHSLSEHIHTCALCMSLITCLCVSRHLGAPLKLNYFNMQSRSVYSNGRACEPPACSSCFVAKAVAELKQSRVAVLHLVLCLLELGSPTRAS